MYKLINNQRFWQVYFAFIVLSSVAIIGIAVYKVYAQEPVPQPTGYYIMVEKLTVPDEINTQPIGTFVAYQKDGTTVIWRENINLPTYKKDAQLQAALNSWANQYIKNYERQQALKDLSATSAIIGVKLGHVE